MLVIHSLGLANCCPRVALKLPSLRRWWAFPPCSARSRLVRVGSKKKPLDFSRGLWWLASRCYLASFGPAFVAEPMTPDRVSLESLDRSAKAF